RPRRHRGGRRRLPEPARHRDRGQRRGRGAGGGRAVPGHPARRLDQGLDRPHPGRGGHRRIGVRPGRAGGRPAARHPQQPRARPAVRPADTLRQQPLGQAALRDEQFLRLRRQQLFARVREGLSVPRRTATIEGIGFWADGLPSWRAARDFAAGGALDDDAPRRPSPRLLAANEHRRAPGTVAVALEVALAACTAAGRDPASLPSVFASTYGDLAITDYMCATLADDPRAVSPTKFHNSVHNAAAGYWTIGSGCMHASTAISACDASFAQGLVEALAQLADGADAVLLAAYD